MSMLKWIDGLGRVRYELRPDRQNLVAGIIIAALLIGGCVALIGKMSIEIVPIAAQLPWYTQRGSSWFGVAIGISISVALATMGGFLFWWAITNWSLAVTVCESGFEWRTRKQVKRYLWDEMSLVREVHGEERVPLVKGPMKFAIPTQMTREFSIHFTDGTVLDLTANALQGHSTLGSVAKREAVARGIPTKG